MAIEAWHRLFDAIEPPAGKSLLVCRQDEKQVQPKILRSQSWKDAFAPEAMVNPRERRRDRCALSAAPVMARAFSVAWHDLRDGKCETRRDRNATCLFAKSVRVLTSPRKFPSCRKDGFQVSLESERHARSHARRAGEEQPPKDIQSTEQKTTAMRTCLGK